MLSARKRVRGAGNETILFAHKASILMEQEQIETALHLCEEGAKRFPFYADGHFMLGRCYQMLSRFKEAQKEYERALFFEPGNLAAQKALAYIYFKLRLKNKANDLLMTAALYDPLNYDLIDFLKTENLYRNIYTDLLSAQSREDEPKVDIEEIQISGKNETPEETFPSEEDETADESPAPETMDDSEESEEQETEWPATKERDEALKKTDSNLESDSDLGNDFEINHLINTIDGEDHPIKQVDTSEFDRGNEDFSHIMEGLFQPEDDSMPHIPTEDQLKEETLFGEGSSSSLFEDAPRDLPSAWESELEEESSPQNKQQNGQASDEHTEETSSVGETEAQPWDKGASESQSADSDTSEQEKDSGGVELDDVIQRIDDHNKQSEQKTSDEQEEAEESVKKNSSSDSTYEKVNEVNQMAQEESDIEEILANPSLTTSTFGEILIAQKRFGDALRVFQELLKKDPDNLRFKKKIDFLKKLKDMNAT